MRGGVTSKRKKKGVKQIRRRWGSLLRDALSLGGRCISHVWGWFRHSQFWSFVTLAFWTAVRKTPGLAQKKHFIEPESAKHPVEKTALKTRWEEVGEKGSNPMNSRSNEKGAYIDRAGGVKLL